MADIKRYYWLKLPHTYFNQLEQKKMKKHENGCNMQVIYLRMMLLSINTEGYIYYQGVYDTLEEELAEEFNEPIELIKTTLEYLKENHMIQIGDDNSCFIPEAEEHTGREDLSTERVRKYRARKKEETECNKCNVTETFQETECNKCNVTETFQETECNKCNVTETFQETECNKCNNDETEVVVSCNTEKEKEVELEKEKEVESEASKSKRFTPPTYEEVENYCLENNYTVNAERFVDFYEAKGWLIGKNKMKDWKAAVRTWERKQKEQREEETKKGLSPRERLLARLNNPLDFDNIVEEDFRRYNE